MRRTSLVILVCIIFLLVAESILIGVEDFHAGILSHPTELGLLLSLNIILLAGGLALLQRVWYERKEYSRLGIEKIETELKLHEQENLFDIIFNHTNTCIALLNLDTSIFKINHAFRELLGYRDIDMSAVNLYQIVHPDNRNDLQMHIQELIERCK